MFYPLVNENTNTRDGIRQFLGYNHTEAAADGEFYDMRNLTSDHFPIMAPRPIRNVLLSLDSQDWREVPVEITAQYFGEVSKSYVLYTTSDFPIGKANHESIVFSVSQDIGDIRVVVSYLDEKGKVLRTEEYDGPSTFKSRGDVVAARIKIYGYPAEDVELDPDKLDTYVTDIAVYTYNEHIRGMLVKNQSLAYMIGSNLYYGDDVYDMSEFMPENDDRISRQQFLSFGAYILIFPLGLYFNTIDPEDRGYLGAYYEVPQAVLHYYPVDLYGKDISNVTVFSDVDPGASVVGEGGYWVDTSTEHAMYQSTGSGWVPVSTAYIRIEIIDNPVDLTTIFKEGDALFMNTPLADVNEGSVIQRVEADAFTVIAFPENGGGTYIYPAGDGLYMERRIPYLDFVCEYNNRVWGCCYGYVDGKFVNEIYACKQGDPKNWYDYQTLLGAYTVSLGTDGPFTGAITYQGYPTFFKENAIYRIFGTLPSNYQVVTLDARGVQLGSERSLAVCGEYLIYKSMADICAFDGSTPVAISGALGSEVYTEAVAGAAMNKYYISMYDSTGTPQLLVYDLTHGIWMKEDELRIEEFDYTNAGQLYGQTGLDIYGFGLALENLNMVPEPAEDYVSWYAETGRMGFEYPDHKYVQRLTIRAHIPYKSEIRVSISHDSEKFEEVTVLRGKNKITSQTIDIIPERCDHYQLRLEGHGDVKIYSITRTLEVGDDA